MKRLKEVSPKEKAFNAAISTELIHATTNGMISYMEPYKIKIKADFDSAGWLYGPPHHIYLGESLYDENKKHDHNVEKIGAFLRHEFCHYAWTEKNMDIVRDVVDQTNSSFSLWNIFEDARIEHIYRSEFGENFNWGEFIPLNAIEGLKEPADFLLEIVQREGTSGFDLSVLDRKQTAMFKKVCVFYKRICACECTDDMASVMNDWMIQYPRSQPTYNDLSLMASLMASPTRIKSFRTPSPEDDAVIDDIISNFESNCFSYMHSGLGGAKRKGWTSEDESGGRSSKEEEEEDTSSAAEGGKFNVDQLTSISKSSKILNDRIYGALIDEAKVNKVAQSLRKIITKGLHGVSDTSKDGGKRLSARHLGGKEIRYMIKKPGKQNILDLNIIFDCSGSMRGDPLSEGRVLISALNNLSKVGLVKGNLILSKIDRDDFERFETIPFPMKDDVPNRIVADGTGEGIQHAIDANIKLIKRHKCLLVYTDAKITDRVIETNKLNKQGIFPFGLYVDSEGAYLKENSNEMLNMNSHFKSFLIREDIKSLAEAMGQRTSLLTSS